MNDHCTLASDKETHDRSLTHAKPTTVLWSQYSGTNDLYSYFHAPTTFDRIEAYTDKK